MPNLLKVSLQELCLYTKFYDEQGDNNVVVIPTAL
jgi:hypothetical protein